MLRRLIFALFLLSVLAVACTGTLPAAQESASPAIHELADTKQGTMRIEMKADADVADIPWLISVERLKEQGYAIETISFADLALPPAAMAAGDLDIASPGIRVGWAAISKGAPIFTFMDTYANTVMLVARKEIQKCADLDGRSVAVPSVASVRAAMVNAFLTENCPNVNPDILLIKGGSNRMAALLTGELDAAAQDIDDLIRLEAEKPGEFHALTVFAQEFPGVQITSFMARREFAEQHPEMVKDVIRALLAARRDLQNPEVLSEAIVRYIGLESGKAQQLSQLYLAQEIWDTSGEYTLEAVQTNIDFFQEYGDLPAGLRAEDVVDLSYYDAVLDEIGRE